jgi:hypothetical protein
VLKTLHPYFEHLGLIEQGFSITFFNERSLKNLRQAGVERTIISRITLAEEVAIFYKKVAQEMCGQILALDRYLGSQEFSPVGWVEFRETHHQKLVTTNYRHSGVSNPGVGSSPPQPTPYSPSFTKR